MALRYRVAAVANSAGRTNKSVGKKWSWSKFVRVSRGPISSSASRQVTRERAPACLNSRIEDCCKVLLLFATSVEVVRQKKRIKV